MIDYDDVMYHIKCFRKIRKHNLWKLYYETWDKYLNQFSIYELADIVIYLMKLNIFENNYIFSYLTNIILEDK